MSSSRPLLALALPLVLAVAAASACGTSDRSGFGDGTSNGGPGGPGSSGDLGGGPGVTADDTLIVEPAETRGALASALAAAPARRGQHGNIPLRSDAHPA